MSEMTTEILEQNIGKIVLVKLKGGKGLRGRLKGFDQHLNLVLEETDDTSNPENMRKLGLIIVRGDNVVLISPPPRWQQWEKALPQWVNGQAKSSTSDADAAEEEPTTYATRDAQPAATAKPPLSENTVGRPRLSNDKESSKQLLLIQFSILNSQFSTQ